MRDFVERNSLGMFFLLAITLGWFWWIQMVLGLWPNELIIIPSSLGGLSPILSLWILQKISKQAVNLEEIFDTAKSWKNDIPWLILAAFALPVVITLGNCLSFLAGYETQLNFLNPGPAELGLALLAIIPLTFFPGLITSPLFEEPGWRGFALPRLQAKFGREIGSLIVGSYWWLWHQMSNLYWGILPTLLGYLSMLGHSFTIDSLYNLSKRNILVAMFAHQSLFIVNTYLYKSTNEFSTIIIMLGVWILIFILRMIEKRGKIPIKPFVDKESVE